jgi:hypothetical protein
MSEEIGLRERIGSTPVPPSESETEPDPTPVVESPLPGLPQAPSPIRCAPAEMSLVHYLDEPLYRAKGWIQLMGVLFILHGVLMALSLVGIILCWLPIWLGLTLMSAAKNIRAATEFNDQKFLRLALDKIGLYFKINGVLVVIGLVVGILVGVAVALGVLGSAAMMSQGMQNMIQ